MTTTLYSVRDWANNFENNRTKELKKMAWVPIPNQHDGDGYTDLMSNTDGTCLYGCWIIILQIASKCEPRGTLIRSNGLPHTSQSLARMSQVPAGLMARAIIVLVDVGWLQSTPYENPAPSCGDPAPSCASRARAEWNGMERTEQKEQNGNERNGSFCDTGMIGEVDRFFVEIGTLFNRPLKQAVSHLDQLAAVTICKRADIADEILLIKQFKLTAEYFPQSLTSLIEKWDSTVDRARNQAKPNRTADNHDRKENLKINPL